MLSNALWHGLLPLGVFFKELFLGISVFVFVFTTEFLWSPTWGLHMSNPANRSLQLKASGEGAGHCIQKLAPALGSCASM